MTILDGIGIHPEGRIGNYTILYGIWQVLVRKKSKQGWRRGWS